MLAWVVTFREVETGELLPVKVKARHVTDARAAALAQLHDKLDTRLLTGSWSILAVSRTQA